MVAELSGGFAVRTCGECVTDADCAAESLCEPTEVSGAVAMTCRTSQAMSGELCSRDAACEGPCADFTFPDGSVVGVCGECDQDSQCGTAGHCAVPQLSVTGFLGSRCSPGLPR